VLDKNLLISGSTNGQILFWDIRNDKDYLSVFYQTQSDDIGTLDYCDNVLVAGCEDNSICLYDLTCQNEVDAVDLILSPDQPVRKICLKLGPKQNDTLTGEIYFSCHNNLFGIFDIFSGMKKFSDKYENSVF
jgi:WD40 repeat protein